MPDNMENFKLKGVNMWIVEISNNGKDWARWPRDKAEYSEYAAKAVAKNINETNAKNTIDPDKFDPSAYSARAREAPLTQPSPQQQPSIEIKDNSVLAQMRRNKK